MNVSYRLIRKSPIQKKFIYEIDIYKTFRFYLKNYTTKYRPLDETKTIQEDSKYCENIIRSFNLYKK